MQITKINDTTLKTTEVVTIEKELTKDELLDRITNIDINKLQLQNEIAKLDAEKLEIENIITEVNGLGIITKAERQKLQPKEIAGTGNLIK